MEVKEFQNNFLSTLSEIYLESRKSTFTWLDASSFSLSDFKKDTEGERILVAVIDFQVVGFISIWEPDNFIHHLYVSTDHHGKGVGTQLLQAAKSSYESLSLKCKVENKGAIAFYESKGFVKESKCKDVLDDCYLMKLSQ